MRATMMNISHQPIAPRFDPVEIAEQEFAHTELENQRLRQIATDVLLEIEKLRERTGGKRSSEATF